MNKSETLIIYNSVEYFIPFFNKKGIKTYSVYKKASFISQLIRKICSKLGLSRYYWFNDWKKEVKKGNYSKVILFANDEIDVWEYLVKYSNKVIFWYWNPTKIYKKALPESLPLTFLPYSFDPDDCLKFGIPFNSTFYFNNISLPKSEISNDILFVGLDKGRKDKLNKFEADINNRSISSIIYIVGNRNKFGKYSGNQPIEYIDYLKLISKSKVLLDLVQENQSGLTLRCMESIFFEKKLITNDISIVNQPFYHRENIFVIGLDDLSYLPKFVNQPFFKLDSSITNYYDVCSWVDRFNAGE